MTPARIWRERLAGMALLILAVLLGLGLFSHWIPDDNQLFGTVARMADSMRPALLVMTLPLAAGLAGLGARRLALAVLAGVVAGFCMIAVDYRSRATTQGGHGDLKILWYNVLGENDIPADRLADAIRRSGADIVALAEARPAFDAIGMLGDLYPYRLGCDSLIRCQVAVLSRLPLGSPTIRDLASGPKRLLHFSVVPEPAVPDPPPGRERPPPRPVDIVVAHMGKPWYLHTSAREQMRINRVLGRLDQAPLVFMGDLNAAPWSRQNRQIEMAHGLRHAPYPVATWPAALGPAGIPIDHVLVRDATIVAQTHWGDGLGSNHRGILAEIAFPFTNAPETDRK